MLVEQCKIFRINKLVRTAPHREYPQLDVGKVIIDTDGGPDDAAAIFMALNTEKYNSSFKVLAITCVNGNTALDNVIINVFKTLHTVNGLHVCPSTLFEDPLSSHNTVSCIMLG